MGPMGPAGEQADAYGSGRGASLRERAARRRRRLASLSPIHVAAVADGVDERGEPKWTGGRVRIPAETVFVVGYVPLGHFTARLREQFIDTRFAVGEAHALSVRPLLRDITRGAQSREPTPPGPGDFPP